MKKLLLLLIALMFLAVSCSSSKKTENDADTDILPDENAADLDENEDDNDEELNNTDEDENEYVNPCDKIDCGQFAHASGTCEPKDNLSFSCDCDEGYFWGYLGCKKITFANICTGQTKCYNNKEEISCPDKNEDFYGQDAQYAKLGYCISQNFSTADSDNPTILDYNLKIEWTDKNSDSAYTWEEAVKYCEELEYAGYDDWRLPLPKELMSYRNVLNFKEKSDFWSMQEYTGNDSYAWYVDNNSGAVLPEEKTQMHHAHCVRGEPLETTSSFGTITIGEESIDVDYETSLAWLRTRGFVDGSWQDSLAFCENLTFAGFSDWRLPNINEFFSIVDHAIKRPAALPPGLKEIMQTVMYEWWNYFYLCSSTSNNSENALGIEPMDGNGKQLRKPNLLSAFCVRNEPCARDYFWNGKKCVSLCNPNPCENDKHSDGICSIDNLENYSCGCVEGYFWNGKECVSPCDPNMCSEDKNSTGECIVSNIDSYECVCRNGWFWNGKKCVSPCNPNTCGEDKNSTGECMALNIDSYQCICLDNWVWDNEKCVDPCAGVSCAEFEHASGNCKSLSAFFYSCSCDEGYFWWGKETGCTTKKPTSANVCTGQNRCYDNEKEIPCPAENEDFFGQDAHYARLGYCIPQNFSIDNSVENEPVVVDNNTGNIWQRNIPPLETLYSKDVSKYCEDLNYGGYDDWTLPSVEDFMTIADYGRYNPAIKTEYFPDYKNFWTSSGSSSGSGGGIDNHGYYSVYGYTAIFDFTEPSTSYVQTYYYDNYSMISETNYAYSFNIRCLRRNSLTIPPRHFTSKTFGSSVMWNNYNDLIFAEKTGKELSWSEAMKYCSELDYAGISDWRLPNVKELFFNSKRGFHSSTTAPYDFNYDYSSKEEGYVVYQHSKESQLTDTFCVANDPCESGLFWNGEKCAKNPCSKDPCKSDNHSDRICIVLDEENYSCNCNKNYKWSPEKRQCVRTCQDNPCSTYSNSDKQCYDDDVEGFYCGCIEPYFWNANSRKCTQNCDHNPCLNEANSTHECFPDEKNGYTCGCNDGYVWLRLDGCVTDFCKLDSCKNISNSSGECRIVEEFGYLCECLNGTLWNPIEKNCGEYGLSFDWGTE
ncbi:DUF1566 domain-containing protein [bacterium]|nr:DUF1566 domain-containing protein [bacterium]